MHLFIPRFNLLDQFLIFITKPKINITTILFFNLYIQLIMIKSL